MAGMFYSLKETAEKLGATEDAVKQLAKEGKLREFRDGSNLLFKIEEVESLLAEGIDVEAEPQAAPEELPPDVLEIEAESASEEPFGSDMFELEEEAAPEAVGAEEEPDFGVPDIEEETSEPQAAPEKPEPQAAAEEPELEAAAAEPEPEGPELDLVGEAEGTSELGLAPEETAGASATGEEEDLFLAEEEEQPAARTPEESDEEILLAPESGMLGTESDITDMDTALTGEGVSVLGETDTGYDVTDDSLAETVGPAGTSTEASLEEIEDDVNLDSFGSGSGLLDLSLQADDTSLGGILDEIYTAEGGEEAPAGEPGGVEDITAEAETVVPEEELAAPEPVAITPTITPSYVEALPDTQSNILGMLLFLPLAALLYTAIVAVSGQRGVVPSILESIQGLIWYIVGGAIVVAAVIVGVSFAAGRDKSAAPARTKTKKARKEKAPKAKKEKKPKAKKEKKPKAEKPKKEKKPLFGKKKKG